MKTFISKSMAFILSTLVLIFSLTAYPTVSKSAGQLKISLDNVVSKAGQNIQVDMKISNASAVNGGIVTADFRVHYDNTKLQLVSVNKGTIVPSKAEFSSNPGTPEEISTNPGSIAFLFNGVAESYLPITSDGVFTSIVFKVKSDTVPGNFPVSIDPSRYALADTAFNEIRAVALSDGSIQVEGAKDQGSSPTNSETAKNPITDEVTGNAKLSMEDLNTYIAQNKPITIQSAGVGVSIPPQSFSSPELKVVLQEASATVELEVRNVTGAGKQLTLTQAGVGESAGLFEIGGQLVDLTARITKVNENQTTSGVPLKVFSEPVAVTMDLTDANLTPSDIAQLTGVRYEIGANGAVKPVKLGGTYDPGAKKFKFYTDRFSLYGVLKSNQLTQTCLKIGSKELNINGAAKFIDVGPMIINNRTMVPIRVVAESLGADVGWDNSTKTVTINLGGNNLNMVIGKLAAGMDTPPQLVGNRTMVPVRYVSENLGASVLWFPSSQTVQIVK